MKGYLYEVSVNPIDAEYSDFNADCLAEEHICEQIGAEYLVDLDIYEQMKTKEALLMKLQKCGCCVDMDKRCFTIISNAKECWFSEKLKAAKKLLDGMSLEEFSTDQQSKVYSLQQLIDDRTNNTIYESSCDGLYHSFDSWMREAEIGHTYYLGAVVGVH